VNALDFSPDRQFDDSTTASFAGNSPPVVGVDAAEDRGEVAGTLAAAAAWRCTGRWAAAPGTRPAGRRGGEIVPSAIRAAVAARCGHLTN